MKNQLSQCIPTANHPAIRVRDPAVANLVTGTTTVEAGANHVTRPKVLTPIARDAKSSNDANATPILTTQNAFGTRNTKDFAQLGFAKRWRFRTKAGISSRRTWEDTSRIQRMTNDGVGVQRKMNGF